MTRACEDAAQLRQRAEQANFRPEDHEVAAGQRGSSTGLAIDWTAILHGNFRSIDRSASYSWLVLPMFTSISAQQSRFLISTWEKIRWGKKR